jgi:hypothetical protein
MATRLRLCTKTKERRSFAPNIRQMLTFLAMTAIELHDTPISAAEENRSNDRTSNDAEKQLW